MATLVNGPAYQLVVLGECGVGKSSLTIQFTKGFFVELYDPTIEDECLKQYVVDDTPARLNILDTAWQEDYSILMRDSYIRQGNGFLLVYSITSRSSFDIISMMHRKILEGKGVTHFPVVIVANQCDSEEKRQVTIDEGRELAKLFSCPFFEASAKGRVNVNEAFTSLVREIRTFNKQHDSPNKQVKVMHGVDKRIAATMRGTVGRCTRCIIS